MANSNPNVEYLDRVDKQIQETRGLIAGVRNTLADCVEQLNDLQLSLNQQRITLLQSDLDNEAG